MNRKRFILLASTICALALLVVTVMPVAAVPPKSSRVQFTDVLEQLTAEGVINSEQAEAIMGRCEPVFGRIERMEHACRRMVRKRVVAQSKPMLMKVSQALGMEPNELLSQLKEGKTIAEIAEEQGVLISVVVEELLAPIREGLDRAVADGKLSQGEAEQRLSNAEVRINKLVHEARLKDVVRYGINKTVERTRGARQTRMLLHQVCQMLNLDREGLFTQLKEGKKIVEIAQEQGISRDELLEALIEPAQDRLDKAVSEGKLDEQKAEEIRQNIEDRLARFVDNFPPGK